MDDSNISEMVKTGPGMDVCPNATELYSPSNFYSCSEIFSLSNYQILIPRKIEPFPWLYFLLLLSTLLLLLLFLLFLVCLKRKIPESTTAEPILEPILFLLSDNTPNSTPSSSILVKGQSFDSSDSSFFRISSSRTIL